MINDTTLLQWLNLLNLSPDFVIRHGNENESSTTTAIPLVPKDDGDYWIAGVTILANGNRLDSVFIVDTNSGGELSSVYWKIDNKWWDFFERPAVFAALSLNEKDVFPFDWQFSVPLEEDIFHD